MIQLSYPSSFLVVMQHCVFLTSSTGYTGSVGVALFFPVFLRFLRIFSPFTVKKNTKFHIATPVSFLYSVCTCVDYKNGYDFRFKDQIMYTF